MVVPALLAAVVLAACGGQVGDADPEPTSAPAPDPIMTDPGQTTAEPPTRASLGPWIELDGRDHLLASDDAGRALVTGGATTSDGASSYREAVVAYDGSDGSELWRVTDVREVAQLPDVASDDEVVVLVTRVDGEDRLVGLEWATGTSRWSVPVATLESCGQVDLVPEIVDGLVLAHGPREGCGPGSPTAVQAVDAATGAAGQRWAESEGTLVSAMVDGVLWAVAAEDGVLTASRVDVAAGEVASGPITWPGQGAPQGYAVSWLTALGDGTAGFTVHEETGLRTALLAWDRDTPVLAPYAGAEGCLWNAVVDLGSRTCLAADLSGQPPGHTVTSLHLDGETYWEREVVGAGFISDGWGANEPITVPGRSNAWLLSAGDDLLTLVDGVTGQAEWVAGAGEGAGQLSYAYLPEAGVIVASVAQPGTDATVVLRVDAATGAVLDRQDMRDAWITGTGRAVVSASPEGSLLAVVVADDES